MSSLELNNELNHYNNPYPVNHEYSQGDPLPEVERKQEAITVAKNEKEIDFHGIKTVAVNYKGVQIIFNSMNGCWMLFFKKDGKWGDMPPFAGTLTEMKSIVNSAIKKGKGGEQQLLQADTY